MTSGLAIFSLSFEVLSYFEESRECIWSGEMGSCTWIEFAHMAWLRIEGHRKYMLYFIPEP